MAAGANFRASPGRGFFFAAINNMFFKPRCSPETALDQSGETMSKFLGAAEERLDRFFGKGYAAKNPGLLGELVRTQAYDFRTTILLDGHYEISGAMREISTALSEIASALQNVADGKP